MVRYTPISFVFDAMGRKLAETDSVPFPSVISPFSLPSIGPGTGIVVGRPYSVTRTEYCGNCVYLNGQLQRLLFPGGYATPKTGGFDYHYFVCDYLGSVRAVVAEDGTVEETSDYYPYGMQMPNSEGEIPSVQPYKFGGKEHLTAAGLNLHDFGPRALYAPAGQFASADPKCEDYPHLSPYLYCAANPINAVDPTGKDVFILKSGIHLAMLIQDDNDEWYYYSINGKDFTIAGSFSGAKTFNDTHVGKDGKTDGCGWESPVDFLQSDYNKDLGKDGEESEEVSNIKYKHGLQIETTKEQDNIMREAFESHKNDEYKLFNNNCVTTVQDVLVKGGIIDTNSTRITSFLQNGETYKTPNISSLTLFITIKKQYPSAKHIEIRR